MGPAGDELFPVKVDHGDRMEVQFPSVLKFGLRSRTALLWWTVKVVIKQRE